MIRAYAQYDHLGMKVALSLVRHPEPGSYPPEPQILRIGHIEDGPQVNVWEVFDPQLAGPEPTLWLGMDEALALQEALSELQHGTAEVRALRKDYDDERKRVDRLIDTVTTVATGAGR